MPSMRRIRHGQDMTQQQLTNRTTGTDAKIEAVQRLYAAVGAMDVGAILAELDDDVDWAPTGSSDSVPWFGSYQGKAEVPRFFEAIGSSIDIHEFSPLTYTSNETDVIVPVHWSYTVKATGKRAEMTMQHWWRFAPSGKIVHFRGAEDTEQSAAAFSAAT
jgi:ketosteroid isomerase-like protein